MHHGAIPFLTHIRSIGHPAVVDLMPGEGTDLGVHPAAQSHDGVSRNEINTLCATKSSSGCSTDDARCNDHVLLPKGPVLCKTLALQQQTRIALALHT